MSTAAIKQLISQYALTGTPQEIADALNAKSVRVEDHTMRTYASLANLFGSEAVAQFDTILQQAGMEWARLTLAGAGIDFANPETERAIDSLVTANLLDTATANQLKALGVQYASPYEQVAGPGNVVTVEQVQEALEPVAVAGKSWSLILRSDGDRVHMVWTVQPRLTDGTYGPNLESFLSGDAMADNRIPDDVRAALAPVIAFAGARAASL